LKEKEKKFNMSKQTTIISASQKERKEKKRKKTKEIQKEK